MTNVTNFTDRLMELMPDGPPDDSVRETVALVELVTMAGGTPDEAEEYIKINTDRQYRLELKTGVSLDARRRGRKTWDVVMASPSSPGGQRLRQTYAIEGEKIEALLGMMQLSHDYGLVKSRLVGFVDRFMRPTVAHLDEGPAYEPKAFGPARETLLDDESTFDVLYRFSKKMDEQGFLLDFNYLDIKPSDLSGFSAWRTSGSSGGAGHMEFLATIALHEIWIEQYDKTFKEELAMAHSEGRGPVWWRIYGGHKGINRAKNSLTHNNHMVVLDNQEQIYLRIQDSEKGFVEGLVSTHQLRAKMVDEPAWDTAVCGKKHVNVVAHARACSSCHREKSNLAAAESAAQAREAVVEEETQWPVPTGAVGKTKANKAKVSYGMRTVPPTNGKKVEEKHWEARNGPVITVQGPQESAEDDYEAKAKENRRVADELLAQAAYYEQVAEHFEALLQPTPAVQAAETAYEIAVKKAQQILDEAKAKVESERSDQRDALKELIASGPPA